MYHAPDCDGFWSSKAMRHLITLSLTHTCMRMGLMAVVCIYVTSAHVKMTDSRRSAEMIASSLLHPAETAVHGSTLGHDRHIVRDRKLISVLYKARAERFEDVRWPRLSSITRRPRPLL
jgi:hypothetical protein